MFYRETGLYRTSYRQDQSLFNLPTDRNALIVWLLVGFVGMPLLGTEYWLASIMIPVLIMVSITMMRLNIMQLNLIVKLEKLIKTERYLSQELLIFKMFFQN